MARARVAYDGMLPVTDQRVVLNGRLRRDLVALSVSAAAGTDGWTAELEAIGRDWDWDEVVEALRVQVFVPASSSVPLFSGWTTGIGRNLTADGESVLVRAASALGLSDRIALTAGYSVFGPRAAYPRRANFFDWSDIPTGWTFAQIVADWFAGGPPSWRGGGGLIAQSWRESIRLGDLSALAGSEADMGDIEFEPGTLREALERVAEMAGVEVVESFDREGRSVISFYDPSLPGPRRPVVLPDRDDDNVARGASVIVAAPDSDASATTNRVVAWGDFERLVVTVASTHPVHPLERLWDPELEARVLKNPELALDAPDEDSEGPEPPDPEEPEGDPIEGSGSNDVIGGGPGEGDADAESPESEADPEPDELRKVFRRYRIPRAIRQFGIETRLPLPLPGDQTLRWQCLTVGRRVIPVNDTMTPGDLTFAGWDPEDAPIPNPSLLWNGYATVVKEEPSIIRGATLDAETGVLTLPGPAVDLIYLQDKLFAEGDHRLYREASIAVTIAVPIARIGWDTGASGEAAFTTVAADMAAQLVNASYGRTRLTSRGVGLVDPISGASPIYDLVLVVDEDGPLAKGTYAWDQAVLVRDDIAGLRALAESTLRESNRIDQSMSITTPWLAPYRIGDQLELVGPGPRLPGLRVRAVTWDLRADQQATTLRAEVTRGRGTVRLASV